MSRAHMALALVALCLAAPAAARSLRDAAPAPKPAIDQTFEPEFPITEEETAQISGLFDAWNAALATLDPEKVADMYADDAILLPTVSNLARPNRESKLEYFTMFLKLKPQGAIDESYVRWLNEDKTVAANSGIYTFALVQDGKPTKVQARYTYIYKLVDGEWKIAEHHSSAMPEKTDA